MRPSEDNVCSRQESSSPELRDLKVRIAAVERQVDEMLLKSPAQRITAIEEKLRTKR